MKAGGGTAAACVEKRTQVGGIPTFNHRFTVHIMNRGLLLQ